MDDRENWIKFYLDSARKAQNSGKYRLAVSHFQNAANHGSTEAVNWLKRHGEEIPSSTTGDGEKSILDTLYELAFDLYEKDNESSLAENVFDFLILRGHEETARWFRENHRQTPEELYTEDILSAAKILLFNKEYGFARELFVELEKTKPELPEALYYLGLVYSDFGMGFPCDEAKAKKYFKKSWEGEFAPAGLALVGCEGDDIFEDLSAGKRKDLRKLLEKSAKMGCKDAAALLTTVDMDSDNENAVEELLTELLKIRDQETDYPEIDGDFSLYLLSLYRSHSWEAEDRFYAWVTLDALTKHWNPEYAALGLRGLAELFRDGVIFYQNLEKAEELYRKAAEIGGEDEKKELEKFLSGEWKNIPEEELPSWRTDKILEGIKKTKDEVYLILLDWLDAESAEEIIAALDKFPQEKQEGLECLKSHISATCEFCNEEYETDCTDIVNSAVEKELEELEEALDEFYECIKEYRPFFAEKTPDERKEREIDKLNRTAQKKLKNVCKAESSLEDTLLKVFGDVQEEAEGAPDAEEEDDAGSEDEDTEKSGQKFCIHCGAKNPGVANFCRKCGKKVNE